MASLCVAEIGRTSWAVAGGVAKLIVLAIWDDWAALEPGKQGLGGHRSSVVGRRLEQCDELCSSSRFLLLPVQFEHQHDWVVLVAVARPSARTTHAAKEQQRRVAAPRTRLAHGTFAHRRLNGAG
ncbi:hypothetical protein GALMADRAFT_144387 [Galerina marginata CBS 339.88]|uniref:Uncharacterized protein n=1 Tax=Galerina marginata (strain CBS 339.88) TaxID=685588 RepID=A0A067SVY4_GALM3|nr:hypothetical protein GALMADRAFT_144387 [Galerina marginata CBS 339.88]